MYELGFGIHKSKSLPGVNIKNGIIRIKMARNKPYVPYLKIIINGHQLDMKKLSSILFVVLMCIGCRKDPKYANRKNSSESFDLSKNINIEFDSIRNISQLMISEPGHQRDYDTNDSITRRISVHTEKIISLLIESYGSTPTDTILSILKNLDNSGYIPIELYEKLDEEDFSTEIGERAKSAHQKYLSEKNHETKSLKSINLLNEKLTLIRVIENDTIKLSELLQRHKGYKVLDFWATWCAPCRSFNKGFQNHYLEYRDKGIEFYGIGINVDSEMERNKFLTAIKNDNTPWYQFMDINNGVYELFGTNTVPYQVLLDMNNQVVKILTYDIKRELDEILEKIDADTRIPQ
tara:strand:- start:960 stop:2006 length:1047 start_codon:yes stop_codon:yes gene_type:complete